MKEPLTHKQLSWLNDFREFVTKMSRAPMYLELALMWDISAAEAWDRVGSLIRKGWLRREHKRNGFLVEVPDSDPGEIVVYLSRHNVYLGIDSPFGIPVRIEKK